MFDIVFVIVYNKGNGNIKKMRGSVSMKSVTLHYVTDYYKRYVDSEKSKEMNMFEFGILELTHLCKIYKRSFITKAEYNRERKEIEKQLLFPYHLFL